MNNYPMSDDLFRQRALEEDGCMITAIGAGLVKAMNFDGQWGVLHRGVSSRLLEDTCGLQQALHRCLHERLGFLRVTEETNSILVGRWA